VTTWKQQETVPQLFDNHIHIWRVDVSDFISRVGELAPILSAKEKTKSERFHFEKDCNNYIVSQACLRLLLGTYLNIPPNAVELCEGAHGKPYLKQADGFQFNLSNSHGCVIYAFTLNCEIGIDTEYSPRTVEFHELATRFFTKSEANQLLKLKDGALRLAFFNVWTRKEAFIKAIGEGLSFPLKNFEVSVNDPARIVAINGDELEAKEWFMQAFEPEEDYVAAVTVKNKINLVSYYKVPMSLLQN